MRPPGYRDAKIPRVCGEVTLGDDGIVRVLGEKWLHKAVMTEHVVDGKTYSPNDGMEFIAALPFVFRGSYLAAEVVTD